MFRIIQDDENLKHEILDTEDGKFEIKSECLRIDKYRNVIGTTEAFFGPFDTHELAESSLKEICKSYKILE